MSAWTTTHTAEVLHNTHHRITDGPIEAAERLLASVGSPEDLIWPADRWPPMRLDAGHAVGSSGGHGPIRYSVECADPRSIKFAFADGGPTGNGWHRLTIEPYQRGQVRWTHDLHLENPPRSTALIVLPLHDALLEDLLDQVEALLADRAVVRRRLPFPVTSRLKLMAILPT